MKPARAIIMAVAVLAAALAGYLALNMTRQPAVVAEAPEKIVEKMPTVEILVAKQSMPVGARLNEEFLEWKGWPEDALVDGLIRQDERPEAIAELNGAVVGCRCSLVNPCAARRSSIPPLASCLLFFPQESVRSPRKFQSPPRRVASFFPMTGSMSS